MKNNRYITQRNRYLPAAPKLIFIAESPPSSGKYFYDPSGRPTEPLFQAVTRLLKFKPKTKAEGLSEFSQRGYVLVDAIYEPVNKLRPRERNARILSNYRDLIKDLRQIMGARNLPIILIKANVFRLLEDQLKRDGFKVINNGLIVPFPGSGHQKEFQEGYSNSNAVYCPRKFPGFSLMIEHLSVSQVNKALTKSRESAMLDVKHL